MARTLPRNSDLADQLDLLADLLEIEGEQSFRVLAYRRAVLERIDLDGIGSRGYAFQIETTYRALRAGFRVVEVPIRFVDREAGGSKMSRSIVLEAIWKVPALRAAALLGRL